MVGKSYFVIAVFYWKNDYHFPSLKKELFCSVFKMVEAKRFREKQPIPKRADTKKNPENSREKKEKQHVCTPDGFIDFRGASCPGCIELSSSLSG